ncbi:hypothetical protein [Sphingopyxis sp.]|uniref:hypothetical protein n=1 Tax=Sphingopyxis sp. TaxID=1908224 RepID=UPI002D7A144E|nr:hypothetical protein [Sphingopyxis sp.]HET6523824.1 hypothetical protein [Sphingopyxis sp.]
MTDDDIPTWTLSEHLDAGETALHEILADAERAASAQPICHHFDEAEPTDILLVDREDIYTEVSRRLSDLGVNFAADRLEGWETYQPSVDWLRQRIPDLFHFANSAGLIYCGWTWEPRDRQPVSASTVTVVNNRSD